MLAFSRKTDYALVACAELASRGCVAPETGIGGDTDAGACGPSMSAAKLAEATESPLALLRNILKSLAQAGVLDAERGPFGGYWLTRDPRGLSVLDIVEAVEGPVTLARCCHEGESPERDGCVHSPRCRIQHGMRRMHEGVLDVLRLMTVSDLVEPSAELHGAGPTVRRVPIRIQEGAGSDLIAALDTSDPGSPGGRGRGGSSV